MSKLKLKFSIGIRMLGIALVLAFFDSMLRYVIESNGLIEVTPSSLPFVNEGAVQNVVGAFLYLCYLYLWYYLLGVSLFHLSVRKFPGATVVIRIAVGVGVCLLFFVPYWGIVELFSTEILLEGLVVYPVIGVVLALLHRWFFPRPATNRS